MKITSYDKSVAYLALLGGLAISAVAIYYSVAGLVSIFAAAAIPIIIMGVVLEVGKLIATIWLKLNWNRAPALIRSYLLVAVFILMGITSMGIFGYLSKAHLDQSVPTGDVADKVALIDEKIQTQKDNIDTARKALSQLDASVDQVMARSTSEQGATKASQMRKAQAKERAALQKDVEEAQAIIAKLNEEKAPIAKELRKVEAEVGPIKYIAALIYGDQLDSTSLERAVRWVIILLVIIFDPLAVVLLLASQYSFQWFRETPEPEVENDYPVDEKVDELISTEEPVQMVQEEPEDTPPEVEPIVEELTEPVDDFDISKHAYLKQPWVWRVPGVDPVGPQVYIPEEPVKEEKSDELTPELLDELRMAFPDYNWDEVHKKKPLTDEQVIQIDGQNADSINKIDEAVEPLERPGDYIEDDGYIAKPDSAQIKMVYVQNSEQRDGTNWNKINRNGNE